MAKRRRKSSSSAGRTTIVRAPAPIVRVSAPRAPKRRRSRRRSGGSLSLGGERGLITTAAGGAALGFLEKNVKLPSIGPFGPASTAAIISWAIGKYGHVSLASELAKGMAAVSLYKWAKGDTASLFNLGGEGRMVDIEGDDDD